MGIRWTLFSAGLLGAILATGSFLVTEAADHRDGPIFPNTPLNGRADINDVYVFRSPADTSNVNFGNTVIGVTISPFPGVLTPTSFDPRLTLDVNVDNTGNATPAFTLRATFAPPTPAGGTFNQVVTLRLIQGNTTTTIAQYTYVGNQVIPPAAFANNVTFPGDAIATGKFIAGNFDDPFFFDAQGFGDFIKTGLNPFNPAHPFPRPVPLNPAKPRPTEAKNFFGPNGNTLAILLEVPTTKLTTANPPKIGVWSVSLINGTQVDRMGRPGINTTLIPPVPRNDLSRGERRTAFNLGAPSTDVANFSADMMAVLTSPKFVFQRTQADATALTNFLLPDILTVDLTKLFADPTNGFPNGRRFRDAVIHIELNLLTNGAVTTDNVDDDNGTRITDGNMGAPIAFPYLGRPNNPPAGPTP